MFGGKKAKLKEKLLEETENIEEVYKFYDYDNKPQEKIEIQAILNNNNSYKVLVILNNGKETTIEYLCVKIAEQMEKFQEFENLEGLKAVNLSKKTEKGIFKIPITGEINEFINDGDIIYCDLNTEEYWVKTTIKMNSVNSILLINLDIKFRLDTIIKKLRFLLMKLGLNFWIDTASQLEDYNHYIFTNLNFKTLKSKNNIDYSVLDLKKGLSIEKKKVSELLDFNSEIQFSITLSSLEEICFNQLKKKNLTKKPANKLKWDEFRDLSYQSFSTNLKFIQEKKYFQNFIKRLILSDQQNSKRSFYLYNRNYSVKTHQIIEDEDLAEENSAELSNLIILPYNRKRTREASTRSTLEPHSNKKLNANEAEVSPINDAAKNSILINKSDKKFYSNKILCVKNHKDSICSLNAPNYNLDISIAQNDKDDLVSNYTNNEDDFESNSSNNNNNIYLDSNKHRNTKSFHDNSKIIREFSSNFERGESQNFKCEKNYTNSTDKHDAFYENCKKSFKRLGGLYQNRSFDTSLKINKSTKTSEVDQNNRTSGGNEDESFNNKNTMLPFEGEDSKIREKQKMINFNNCEGEKLNNALGKNNFIGLEENELISKTNAFSIGSSEYTENDKSETKLNILDNYHQPNENKLYIKNSEEKYREIIPESHEKETNIIFRNAQLYANKSLFKSCPIKSKNPKEIEESEKNNNICEISDLFMNKKFNSSNEIECKYKPNQIVNKFTLEDSQNNKNSGAFYKNLTNVDGTNNLMPPKFLQNNTNREVHFCHLKHKTSTDLNTLLDNTEDILSDKNQNTNCNEIANDSNVRKYSFFYNFRNQANLVKDLKMIVKTINFKEEIEKFSRLKISKHILERIHMPPFRNVQIERKITEEPDNNINCDNNMDEPLRINNIQILSFLIFLILLFIIAILLIFLIDN